MFGVFHTIDPAQLFSFTLENTSASLYALIELGAVLINLMLAALVWRMGSRIPAARWFILFLLTLSVWGIAQVLGRLSPTPEGSIFWARLGPIGWVFLPVIYFMFSAIFTRREALVERFWVQFLLWVPAVAFLFLAWNTNLLVVHNPRLYEFQYYGWDTSAVGVLFTPFIIWLESYFIISLYFMFKYYKSVKERNRKNQALLIMVGILNYWDHH